jgi:hypothetical protein
MNPKKGGKRKIIYIILAVCFVCLCLITRRTPQGSPEPVSTVPERTERITPTASRSAGIPNLAPADIRLNLEQRGFTCSNAQEVDKVIIWECEKRINDTIMTVSYFSDRIITVNGIEAVILQMGSPSQEIAQEFLGFIATLPFIEAEEKQEDARNWVETTIPTLSSAEQSATWSGVDFLLTGNNSAIILRIGEMD